MNLEPRLESCDRPLVLLRGRMQAPQTHHQLLAQRAQRVPLLAAPVGIGIAGEQIAPIQRQRGVVILRPAGSERDLGEALELLDVDREVRRAQLHLLLRCDDEL